MQEYDVIVVGAGPAGSAAARVAAAAGLKVLILERKARPGFPVQCAEYVPVLMDLEVEIPGEAVAQRVEGMEARFPEGTTLAVHAPGFLLRREVFDYALALQAVAAGAELWTSTCVLNWTEKGLIVRREGSLLTLKARVIVGADGPRSVVARAAGYRPHRLAVAYQVEVELPESMRVTQVYFDPAFFGGYAWVFPKGLTANVGVGVTRSGTDGCWPDLRGLLIKFLSFLGWE
ncbi:MAG: FAD-dependent monooxygenase, partial [Moorellaceae bacterium]